MIGIVDTFRNKKIPVDAVIYLGTGFAPVKKPINNYKIIPYIGKYVNFSETYDGEKGKFDLNYWVLDYNLERAKAYVGYEVHHMLKALDTGLVPTRLEDFIIVHESGHEWAGNEYNEGIRRGIRNDRTVIPVYGVNAQGSSDMYPKPSNVLQSIKDVLHYPGSGKASIMRYLYSSRRQYHPPLQNFTNY